MTDSVDPGQTSQFDQSDLGIHCFSSSIRLFVPVFSILKLQEIFLVKIVLSVVSEPCFH